MRLLTFLLTFVACASVAMTAPAQINRGSKVTIKSYTVAVSGIRSFNRLEAATGRDGMFRVVPGGTWSVREGTNNPITYNNDGRQSAPDTNRSEQLSEPTEFRLTYTTQTGKQKTATTTYDPMPAASCALDPVERPLTFALDEGNFTVGFELETADPITQIKIPRILRTGGSGLVRIKAFGDGAWVDTRLFNVGSRRSIIYDNFDNGGFFANGQNRSDLRITFRDKAHLEFTLEGSGATLGELRLTKAAPKALPAFRKFSKGDDEFEVQIWQAICGEAFPFTHPGALTGVRLERHDNSRQWNNWGDTRNGSQLNTVAWFSDNATNVPETWNFFYGPADSPNVVIGAEKRRAGRFEARLGIEARGGVDTRIYNTRAWNGPSTLVLVSPYRSETDPQYRTAIVGTHLKIMDTSSKVRFGQKTTGVQTPLTMPLANGYIPFSYPKADDDVTGVLLKAAKATGGYAYLTGSFVDLPFGKAE